MLKKKILIIDDELSFSRLVKLNLEETARYEVKIENKATEALSVTKEFKPDLILLDILMPEMMGGDVVNQLRNDEVAKDIPIVLLTAMVKKQEVEDLAGIAGKLPIIAKPVTVRELIDSIEKNIGKK